MAAIIGRFEQMIEVAGSITTMVRGVIIALPGTTQEILPVEKDGVTVRLRGRLATIVVPLRTTVVEFLATMVGPDIR